MPQSGYIYILINPTLNGLVKIGKTSKTSEERAKELSSATGVPTQFMVAYDEFFEDIDLAENHVHEVLKNMGHHVFPNKEFFDIPLKEAIGIINETRKYFTSVASTDTESEEIFEEAENVSPHYESILDEALNYKYGIGEYLQDDYEALAMYEKAYILGSGEACYEMGLCFLNGEGCSKNERTALDYFKEGVKRNFLECYIPMSQIYDDLQQYENAVKCTDKFFEKIEKLKNSDRIIILNNYIFYKTLNNQQIHLTKIHPYIKELIDNLETIIEKRSQEEELTENLLSILNNYRSIVQYLKKHE